MAEVAMPGLRDVLDRFRPAGAPGAASAAGVPTDRQASLVAELEPVFTALARDEWHAAEVRRVGALYARVLAEQARRQAEAELAQARTQAPAQRAQAAADLRQRAEAELADIGEQAGRAAEAVRERAGQRIGGLLIQVLRQVRTDIKALAAQADPDRSGQPAGWGIQASGGPDRGGAA
jgi:hypothetical protein